MIILASNSPRRKQLLAFGGWDFQALAPEIDESVQPGEAPLDYVLRLAELKAKAAQRLVGCQPGTFIVAADTAVVDRSVAMDDEFGQVQAPGHLRESSPYEILGKPVDSKDAERMLRRLRDRTHWVYTGVVVLRVDDEHLKRDVCITEVPMRDYSDDEINAYIRTGDPMDKAGAYAIQHPGFKPARQLQGCYANVMGLPVCHLARLFAQFGMETKADIAKSCLEILDYPCPIAGKLLGDEASISSG